MPKDKWMSKRFRVTKKLIMTSLRLRLMKGDFPYSAIFACARTEIFFLKHFKTGLTDVNKQVDGVWYGLLMKAL